MKTFIYHESPEYPELNIRYYGLLKALGSMEGISSIYISLGKGKQEKIENFKRVYAEGKYTLPEDGILMNADPQMHDTVKALKHKTYIFDVAGLPIFRYSAWESSMQKAILDADYVIAISQECKNYVLNTTSREAIVIKNGVDRQAFMDSLTTMSTHNDRHTVGVLGDMSQMDYQLLDDVIRQCAEYNFIFFCDKKKVYPSYGNMVFLKERYPDEYIPIIKGLDAMIVPLKTYPTKKISDYVHLYECIANEKPIIATSALAETSGILRRYIDIQDGHIDFANSIRIAIEGKNSLVKKASMAAVENDDWKNRAEEIISMLET